MSIDGSYLSPIMSAIGRRPELDAKDRIILLALFHYGFDDEGWVLWSTNKAFLAATGLLLYEIEEAMIDLMHLDLVEYPGYGVSRILAAVLYSEDIPAEEEAGNA
jgi:hypothetical protein